MQSPYDSGLMIDGALGLADFEMREAIGAGTIAAMIDGPFAQAIQDQAGTGVRLAFAPAWTDAETGFGGYQWAGSGLAISANSAHPDEAWEFIKWLLSDEITIEITQRSGIWHASNAAFEGLEDSDSPILDKLPDMLNQDPEHNLFLNPVPEGTQLNRALMEAIQATIVGDMSAQEALDEAAAVWNEEFAAYRAEAGG